MDREESCWLRERPRGGTRTRDGVGKHGLSFLQGFLGALFALFRLRRLAVEWLRLEGAFPPKLPTFCSGPLRGIIWQSWLPSRPRVGFKAFCPVVIQGRKRLAGCNDAEKCCFTGPWG